MTPPYTPSPTLNLPLFKNSAQDSIHLPRQKYSFVDLAKEVQLSSSQADAIAIHPLATSHTATPPSSNEQNAQFNTASPNLPTDLLASQNSHRAEELSWYDFQRSREDQTSSDANASPSFLANLTIPLVGPVADRGTPSTMRAIGTTYNATDSASVSAPKDFTSLNASATAPSILAAAPPLPYAPSPTLTNRAMPTLGKAIPPAMQYHSALAPASSASSAFTPAPHTGKAFSLASGANSALAPASSAGSALTPASSAGSALKLESSIQQMQKTFSSFVNSSASAPSWNNSAAMQATAPKIGAVQNDTTGNIRQLYEIDQQKINNKKNGEIFFNQPPQLRNSAPHSIQNEAVTAVGPHINALSVPSSLYNTGTTHPTGQLPLDFTKNASTTIPENSAHRAALLPHGRTHQEITLPLLAEQGTKHFSHNNATANYAEAPYPLAAYAKSEHPPVPYAESHHAPVSSTKQQSTSASYAKPEHASASYNEEALQSAFSKNIPIATHNNNSQKNLSNSTATNFASQHTQHTTEHEKKNFRLLPNSIKNEQEHPVFMDTGQYQETADATSTTLNEKEGGLSAKFHMDLEEMDIAGAVERHITTALNRHGSFQFT